MKTQLFYIIFTIYFSKATENSDTNPTEAGYDNWKSEFAGNQEICVETIESVKSLINKIENTFIYSDGPNKEFKPLREHKHKFEYELFSMWLCAFKNISENMDNQPYQIHEAIKLGQYYCNLYRNHKEESCELYLKKWIDDSFRYLEEFISKLSLLQENDLKINRLRLVILFCVNINIELDRYINNASEFDMNLCKELDAEKNSINKSNSNFLNKYKKLNESIDEIKSNFKENKHDKNINKLIYEIKKIKHNFFVKENNVAINNASDDVQKTNIQRKKLIEEKYLEEKNIGPVQRRPKRLICGTPRLLELQGYNNAKT